MSTRPLNLLFHSTEYRYGKVVAREGACDKGWRLRRGVRHIDPSCARGIGEEEIWDNVLELSLISNITEKIIVSKLSKN